MAGFDNDVVYGANVDFRGVKPIVGQFTTNGQLLIGATAAPYARIGNITSTGGTLTITTGPGTLNIDTTGSAVNNTITGDSGGALSPTLGNFNILGGTNGIDTSGSGSTLTLNFDVTETGCITTVNGDSGSSTATGNAITIAGAGTVTTSASGSTVTITGTGGSTNAGSTIDIVDDFIAATSGATLNSVAGFSNFSSGTGSQIINGNFDTSARPGVVDMQTGTTTSGRAMMGLQQNTLATYIVGGGAITLKWYAKIHTLSDGTDTFTVLIGMYIGITSTITDGIYFSYTNSVNSGKWTVNCTASSVTTTGNTNNTADTNWHVFEIVINAAATSVSFLIDGTEVANSPLAANIPTANIGPSIGIYKSAGTTERLLLVDLFTLHQDLTVDRG